MDSNRKNTLEQIFNAGLEAVDPEKAIHNHMTRDGDQLVVEGRTVDLGSFEKVFLFGAGKGTAPMAKALEDILGDQLAGAWIIVKYDHGVPLKKTQIFEAGHPIPDEAGIKGTSVLLEKLEACTEKDLVLCAFSGGGSALLPAPDFPVDLHAKQKTTQLLLECGATINEINALRKHLSKIKGGRLAEAAYPATCISLILSDVVGDPLDVIASGPTVPDTSTYAECIEIIERYGIVDRLPKAVLDVLNEGVSGNRPETPKRDNPAFETTHNVIVGNNRSALLAAERKAKELGYSTLVLTSCIEGEAKEVAQVMAAIGKEIMTSKIPIASPACVLAGGEPTVTLEGKGKGGRNQEMALAAALALDGIDGISILSAGTDGTDGPTDAAGAFADGTTCELARSKGLSPRSYLSSNDAYNFFDALGDLLITGPTRTNVMDLICLIVN